MTFFNDFSSEDSSVFAIQEFPVTDVSGGNDLQKFLSSFTSQIKHQLKTKKSLKFFFFRIRTSNKHWPKYRNFMILSYRIATKFMTCHAYLFFIQKQILHFFGGKKKLRILATRPDIPKYKLNITKHKFRKL